MKVSFRRAGIAATLALLAAALSPLVSAQAASADAPHQGAVPPTFNPKDAGPPPSDAEIGHFVDASMQVQAISQKARSKFKAAKTDAARASIQKSAESSMEQAVQQNQLTTARYKQIFVAMQTDRSVHQKVVAQLKKKQGK